MNDQAVALLRCPLCGTGMTRSGRVLGCRSGRAFDLGGAGYVNLLGGRRRRLWGDSREMLLARRRFLGRGHYEPLAASVTELVREAVAGDGPAPGGGPCGVEVGSRTGYHLAWVAAALRRAGLTWFGVDASREAARLAARDLAGHDLAFVDADVWDRLPLDSGSALGDPVRTVPAQPGRVRPAGPPRGRGRGRRPCARPSGGAAQDLRPARDPSRQGGRPPARGASRSPAGSRCASPSASPRTTWRTWCGWGRAPATSPAGGRRAGRVGSGGRDRLVRNRCPDSSGPLTTAGRKPGPFDGYRPGRSVTRIRGHATDESPGRTDMHPARAGGTPGRPGAVRCALAAALLGAAALVVAGAPAPAAIHSCFGEPATIVGTLDHDRLVGTDAPDVIVGLAGGDWIEGLGGDDLICAGDGRDHAGGGDGDDRISGGADHDTLFGDRGSDELAGEDGNDRLDGDDDSDTGSGDTGRDALDGGEGNDTLLDDDRGDDRLSGGAGFDYLFAGPGDDTLEGGDGNDELDGGPGRDRCDGGSGKNELTACE